MFWVADQPFRQVLGHSAALAADDAVTADDEDVATVFFGEHPRKKLDQPVLDLHAVLMSSTSKTDLKSLIRILESIRSGIRD